MESVQNQQYPKLGEPILVGGKVYRIREKAVVGETYRIDCPVCKQQFAITPNNEKANIEKCPQCKATFGFNAHKSKEKKKSNIDKNTNSDEVKTAEPIHPKNLLKYQGKLEWGRIFYKKSACLKVGANIIGRKDYDMPSDISFDDDYMSRRSVSIDVEKDTNRAGYKFKLTVINAANPVFVGSTQLYVGNSIYLNYGDTIKMGNTVMTFKESK